MIYIIYGVAVLITIILYFLVEDKKDFLNKLGKVTIISGILVLLIGLLSNIVLNNTLNSFNITRITALIFRKFIYNSIILAVVGLLEVFISTKMKGKKIRVSLWWLSNFYC